MFESFCFWFCWLILTEFAKDNKNNNKKHGTKNSVKTET